MRLLGQPAYVLHARPWRETSLLLEVLTAEHGRMGLVARGVHGPRRQALRAALQPLQHIRFDAVQRGELAHLNAAEAIDAAPRLQGELMLAGFYVNELVLRLAPRQEPQPELYALYGELRARLGAGEPLAWTLRRFERDLLEVLGVGFDLAHDADGVPLDPAARYRLDPEQGPRRVRGERDGERSRSATGRALLGLAADHGPPPPEELGGLRRVLREVLMSHLGARPLTSWQLMADLGRLTTHGGGSSS
ncbi:DNA repair protein RecO [Luteimonas sp. MC1825]|uniref:DNA repair protein RecO n=1 Tax=Luteimonas sp. MC1825 TaxID=2761107 RepID=UPI00160B48D1|nr:DNA repair protein RecO [Luteimonas sp. MC1825]MBB6599729.1 DNA repair protein RecO [Luteimonas sp. MC1825]QOC87410.1 DNA repair protein RecO [Luteimonas sp. MC1825]